MDGPKEPTKKAYSEQLEENTRIMALRSKEIGDEVQETKFINVFKGKRLPIFEHLTGELSANNE